MASVATSLASCGGGDTDSGSGGRPDSGSDSSSESSSESGISGADLVEPFDDLASELYAGADPQRGDEEGWVHLEACPLATDDDAVAIARALGVSDPGRARVTGRILAEYRDSEVVACMIDVGEEWVGLEAGTQAFPDDVVAQAQQREDAVDGEAPGLDPGDVYGVVAADMFVGHAVRWIDGGFLVSLDVPDAIGGPDDAFRALPVAVEAVADSLG